MATNTTLYSSDEVIDHSGDVSYKHPFTFCMLYILVKNIFCRAVKALIF